MWKYAMFALAAVVVIGAGFTGVVLGRMTMLGGAAVALSMAVALFSFSLVVAYAWDGPFSKWLQDR